MKKKIRFRTFKPIIPFIHSKICRRFFLFRCTIFRFLFIYDKYTKKEDVFSLFFLPIFTSSFLFLLFFIFYLPIPCISASQLRQCRHQVFSLYECHIHLHPADGFCHSHLREQFQIPYFSEYEYFSLLF